MTTQQIKSLAINHAKNGIYENPYSGTKTEYKKFMIYHNAHNSVKEYNPLNL